MSGRRLTHVLLLAVMLLLVANLVRPLLEPGTAFAQKDMMPEIAVTSGTTAWVIKDGRIYYLKFEQQFESIRVYGPEDLDK